MLKKKQIYKLIKKCLKKLWISLNQTVSNHKIRAKFGLKILKKKLVHIIEANVNKFIYSKKQQNVCRLCSSVYSRNVAKDIAIYKSVV